jgi:hypothetical protein
MSHYPPTHPLPSPATASMMLDPSADAGMNVRRSRKSAKIDGMNRRFQLSLARSLIAIGLLCASAALAQYYARLETRPFPAIQALGGSGTALAMSVGVLFKRTASISLGGFLAMVPIVVVTVWLWRIEYGLRWTSLF